MLFHGVPRLDRPGRIWLLPAPVAKWLGAGAVFGATYAAAWEFWYGLPSGAAWDQALTWLVAIAGMVVGVLGAFFRPGGHDLGRWANVLLDYLLTPRKAVWRPR